MFDLYPNLGTINKVFPEKISKPQKFVKNFSKKDILSNISNFYMTDSVSRNSPTMSSCSIEFGNRNSSMVIK
jgi:hypothetical protein